MSDLADALNPPKKQNIRTIESSSDDETLAQLVSKASQKPFTGLSKASSTASQSLSSSLK